jgi:hypothetical protein
MEFNLKLFPLYNWPHLNNLKIVLLQLMNYHTMNEPNKHII